MLADLISSQILESNGVINLGRQRFDCQGNKVYIRFPNIKEANAVYNAIRLEHQALAVEYMNPVDWATVRSSPFKGLTDSISRLRAQIVTTPHMKVK